MDAYGAHETSWWTIESFAHLCDYKQVQLAAAKKNNLLGYDYKTAVKIALRAVRSTIQDLYLYIYI